MSSRTLRLTPGRLAAVCLPVVTGGALLRFLASRDNDDPAVRELAVAMGAIAVAVGAIPPAVVSALARLTGEENTAPLLSEVATAVAAGYGGAVLQRSVHPGPVADARIHPRRRHMQLTLTAMGALFACDRSTASELRSPTERLFTPASAGYWLVFGSYMAVTTGSVTRLAWRSSRADVGAPTRAGLRLLTAGTTVLAVQYGQFAAGVAGRRLSQRFPAPVRGMPALAAVTAGGVLIVVGATLPGAVLNGGRAVRLSHDVLLWARLRPLWRQLLATGAMLRVPVSGGLGAADIRLYRRVIEVLDALDRLSSTADPTGMAERLATAGARLGNIPAADVPALARAAVIRQGGGQVDVESAWAVPVPAVPAPPAHVDYRQEAQRLIRTRHYLRAADWSTEHPPTTSEQKGETCMGQSEWGTSVAQEAVVDAKTQLPGCSCANSDWAGYALYAMGNAAYEEYMLELRAECGIHGFVG